MKFLLAGLFAMISASAWAGDRWETSSYDTFVSFEETVVDQNVWFSWDWWKKGKKYGDKKDKKKKKKNKKCKWRCAKKVPELSVGGAVGSIGLLAGLGLILRERRKRN